MNLQKYSWIQVSVFYNRQNWNLLLNKGIKPFCVENIQTGILMNYSINFNKIKGESINIIFQVINIQASEFLKIMQKYFRNFLNDFPSPDR
ncbi:MAG: hypothetical protein ACJ748_09630, partial [Flavisolibacter sp.]